MPTQLATPIQASLDRLGADVSSARDELFAAARTNLLAMTRRQLHHFARLRRWEESDDIVQVVLLRLTKCLERLRPTTTREFLALSATLIRHELIDLANHYYRSHGAGTCHQTPSVTGPSLVEGQPDRRALNPQKAAELAEIHEKIAELPPEDREVFDLHWYHGLSQDEIANMLDVSIRTVKRRWLSAKLCLGQSLGKEFLP